MALLLLSIFFLDQCDCMLDPVCLEIYRILESTENIYESSDQFKHERKEVLILGGAAGPYLLCGLHNTKDVIQKQAIIEWLGALKYQSSLAQLKCIAKSDTNTEIRVAALKSIYSIEPVKSCQLFYVFLKEHQNKRIRKTLARLLSNCVTDESKFFLLQLTTDADPYVRSEAFTSLALSLQSEAIPYLEKALEKEEYSVVKISIKMALDGLRDLE